MADSLFGGRLRIRVCALLVEEGKLLLARHLSPTRPEPVWLPPGGEVEFGETLQNGLIREVREETTLDISVKELRLVHEFIEPPWHAVEFYFRCERTAGEPEAGTDPELDEHEQILQSVHFTELSELKNLEVYPEWLRLNFENFFYRETGVRHVTSVNPG